MKLYNTFILAANIAGFVKTVSGAECSGFGLCGATPADTRNQLYAARQHVCGDTDLWQNDGNYFDGKACLRWPGGNSQQICWDAFDNILNQCRPEGTGLGYHGGSWNWNGRLYVVSACAKSC